MSRFIEFTDAERKFLKATASNDEVTRSKAVTQFLSVVGLPIREATLDGDTTAGIFNTVSLEPGVTPEFPLDPITPGTENEFRAYTNPGIGYIPERTISGNKIILSTIGITNSIDWPLKYAREARWDVISRAMEVFAAGFVKKRNDDSWHTILAAAVDRGMTIYDLAANAGQFTKRLFSLLKCAMARNSGGNSASMKRGKATDVWVSCEAIQEILNWDLSQIPDPVRAQFYNMSASENTTMDICGVKIHEMYELGIGQEYQDYYVNTLGGQLVPAAGSGGPTGHTDADVELGICLDLMNRDSFVFAQTQPLELFEDGNLHRAQKGGWYGWEEYGIGVLDSRRVLPISF